MLFDVTRSELVGIFGEDRIATVPATAFPPAAADTEGARLLQAVGVPTGTLLLRQPDEDDGLLPLVQDVVDIEDFEDAAEGAGDWPVIGWLLNAHLALDPVSGKVYAVDSEEETVVELHADVSSLVQVTLRLQRLLEEFTFSGHEDDEDGENDEEAGFERLDGEVDRIREETSSIDPLPFHGDETVWSVVGDEIAMGQRFKGNSPGARSLYG
ncbi:MULTISPECIES: SUKH-4 family immunity protein [unclassified Streptomyces]|uniref:SUKH-4 family immunity protein n=1 Tax=unclassified Streptomyces TaxID=2593676 RepID=UPI002DDAB6A0|nr:MULTISPECIES: SUKH-4 family immunity protein [unclassified Streptomyces]WSB79498.1 SUKH-4 family immunity protein [Streptomyces sp. NBC_01775]WSS12297.1 SUKH-4 family immunity protein [Streptomyces sp. NBC_01186]WSS41010.1 SUKH-4 family immunity protein [Streptomyces sp. NBC_01187]